MRKLTSLLGERGFLVIVRQLVLGIMVRCFFIIYFIDDARRVETVFECCLRIIVLILFASSLRKFFQV